MYRSMIVSLTNIYFHSIFCHHNPYICKLASSSSTSSRFTHLIIIVVVIIIITILNLMNVETQILSSSYSVISSLFSSPSIYLQFQSKKRGTGLCSSLSNHNPKEGSPYMTTSPSSFLVYPQLQEPIKQQSSCIKAVSSTTCWCVHPKTITTSNCQVFYTLNA